MIRRSKILKLQKFIEIIDICIFVKKKINRTKDESSHYLGISHKIPRNQ